MTEEQDDQPYGISTVMISGASCQSCARTLTASEFVMRDDGDVRDWPVRMTEELARMPLIHPGCGGRLSLIDPQREPAVRYPYLFWDKVLTGEIDTP